MNKLPEAINSFIGNNKVASISVCDNDKPHSFNCFYFFNEAKASIIFKSSSSTKHAGIAKANPYASGTILPAVLQSDVQGLQFTGQLQLLNMADINERVLYYQKYPFAMAIEGNLWKLVLESIKYTDNKLLGFGKKLEWQSNDK